MTEATGEASSIKTPLFEHHQRWGGKIVDFAGYQLPIQYKAGIKAEHIHTRTAAGLFDVSHMGQFVVTGGDRVAALERLMPADVAGLAEGQQRYSFLTLEDGGIADDLMVANAGDHHRVVVNAACKAADFAMMTEGLAGDAKLEALDGLALVALQGPQAAAALARLDPSCLSMSFMSLRRLTLDGVEAWVSRSGYTGEDGYEISLPAAAAPAICDRLVAMAEVEPIGLGARDSLRLEAGLCLYGHDIDTTTSPVEAALTWAISKRRRAEGGYPGSSVIADQLAAGVSRKRVGLRPEGRLPVREGAELVDEQGQILGRVTSGGFGPSVDGPVAMGYLASDRAAAGQAVTALVRGKEVPCQVVKMPFVAHSFYRG